MQIKIGADPELFLTDENGAIVSAHGLIPGTKEKPFLVDNGAIQVDGMALEFNINPAVDLSGFKNNIASVMRDLKNHIPPGYGFAIQPTAEFGKDYIDKQPAIAKQLGCTPDWNAYLGEINVSPDADGSFRTAAGHIHIGWTEDVDPMDPGHFEACCMLTKQLDVALAIPSKLFDNDDKRRKMYGSLGSFRPKSYGVEYRVLSNAWLNNPASISWVYRTAMHATSKLLKGKRFYDFTNAKMQFPKHNPTVWYDTLQTFSTQMDTAELAFFKDCYEKEMARVAALPKKRGLNTTSTAWTVEAVQVR